MKASRVFRYIWRINAITILGATICLMLILGALLWDFSDGLFRSPRSKNTVQVAEHMIDAAEFSLGSFEEVEGLSVLRAELLSKQDSGGKFSSGTSTAIRNFLFYDYDQDVAHWLVSTDEQLFSWHAEVVSPETPPGDRTVVGLLYQVVTEDTNGDLRLTTADVTHVAISDPMGHDYKILLSDIGKRKGYEHIGGGKVLLFYERDGTLRVAEIDANNRTLNKDNDLLPSPHPRTP